MTYNARLINRKVIYLDATTGEISNPSEIEKLLYDIFGNEKYIYAELYTSLAVVTAKRVSTLTDNIWLKAKELGLYDFEVYRF